MSSTVAGSVWFDLVVLGLFAVGGSIVMFATAGVYALVTGGDLGTILDSVGRWFASLFVLGLFITGVALVGDRWTG
jgi:hypothetical protein